MSNLKYRVALIILLVAASAWSLFPRQLVERVKRRDSFVFDTVTRVPIKRGLDLQGGMHLALAVDESKGTVADKAEALDRAIKVVRTRIDEFGVSEPVVQKSGDSQIIVELPGIDDPQRAMAVVQKSAFLEFQITDETQALEKVLPRFDAVVRDAGLALGAAGAFSKLIQQGQFPGEYFVAERDVPTLQQYLDLPAIQAAMPPGKVLRWGGDTLSLGGAPYRPIYMVDSRPIITGEALI